MFSIDVEAILDEYSLNHYTILFVAPLEEPIILGQLPKGLFDKTRSHPYAHPSHMNMVKHYVFDNEKGTILDGNIDSLNNSKMLLLSQRRYPNFQGTSNAWLLIVTIPGQCVDFLRTFF